MQQLSSSQTFPEVPINENFETLEHQQVYGKRHPATTGLTWAYYGGRWGGFSIANGTITLTNAATNYLVVNRSTGVISSSTNTTNWNNTADYARVYKITTAGNVVTAVEDHRAGPNGVHGGGSGAVEFLGQLQDVDTTGATNGQVLTYDTSSSPPVWKPAAGGGGATAGKQQVFIPASAMVPSATNGCEPLSTIAVASGQPDITALRFDPTTTEYAEFSISMPKRWNAGTFTARFDWTHPATSNNFGVVWGIRAVARGDGDPIGTAFGTGVVTTDTGGTTNTLYRTAESAAITASGDPAKEDTVFFQVYRDAPNAADTLAVDAMLLGVSLFYTSDAENDA
jgi:hypothetical protein